MNVEIQWEQPPEAALLRSQGKSGRYIDFAIALKNTEPPEGSAGWAVLPTDGERTENGAKATAQNIRAGKVAGFTKGQFEAVVDGTKVWVRYANWGTPEDAGEEGPERAPAAGDEPPIAPKIRAWARSKGITISDHGRLPRDLMDRYFDETGEERPKSLRVV